MYFFELDILFNLYLTFYTIITQTTEPHILHPPPLPHSPTAASTATSLSLPHFLTSPSTLPLHTPDISLDLTTLDLTTPTTLLILLRMFQPHRTISRGCCIPIGIVLCGTLALCSFCHQQFGHFLKQGLDVDV